MELISNAIIISAVIMATMYCRRLSLRLQKFSRLESEMGSAIALLSREVEQMTIALKKAQSLPNEIRIQPTLHKETEEPSPKGSEYSRPQISLKRRDRSARRENAA